MFSNEYGEAAVEVLDILDNIDYILGKGVLQNVKHKKEYKE